MRVRRSTLYTHCVLYTTERTWTPILWTHTHSQPLITPQRKVLDRQTRPMHLSQMHRSSARDVYMRAGTGSFPGDSTKTRSWSIRTVLGGAAASTLCLSLGCDRPVRRINPSGIAAWVRAKSSTSSAYVVPWASSFGSGHCCRQPPEGPPRMSASRSSGRWGISSTRLKAQRRSEGLSTRPPRRWASADTSCSTTTGVPHPLRIFDRALCAQVWGRPSRRSPARAPAPRTTRISTIGRRGGVVYGVARRLWHHMQGRALHSCCRRRRRCRHRLAVPHLR